MRYELLGPLRVVNGDATAFISAPKIGTLLAALLLRADLVVTHDQLIEEIWGEDRPKRVMASLHVYVSQLRKFLGRLGRPDNTIVTWPSGYLFRTASDELDYRVFTRLVEQGRALAESGQDEAACARLEEALRLWRGAALAELPRGPIIGGGTVWLSEVRLDCLELLIECQLNLGRHRELIGKLYTLTAEYPLREAFFRQLMLALYRADRKAEALRAYQSAREILRDELGLEPCQALQDLQRAILTADDRLNLPTTMAAWGRHRGEPAAVETRSLISVAW